MSHRFNDLNKAQINMQIGFTESQIEALQERLKTNNFKSGPLCSIEQIRKYASMALDDLQHNLRELQALKNNEAIS